MSDVKVTVLMPAHNAAAYIAEAVSSVLEQTYTNFELLIIDDGSIDQTADIVYQFKDNRIRLIPQSHQGIALSLNNGLHQAKGEYIARFDADDICKPDRLQKQVDFLNNNPGYVLTGSDAMYITESGEYLFDFTCLGHTHEEIIQQLYNYCPFIHSSVIYRKEAVLNAGGYSADCHNFEDYLLWTQLCKYGKYFNLKEQLVKIRFNPASATIDEKWRGSRFRKLKRDIIEKGSITTEEGKRLKSIIDEQNVGKLKKAAYHALCGKKFLVNNHQPRKAREQLAKAIHYYPSRLDNYLLYAVSFFPKSFVNWLHGRATSKQYNS
jgi:glycosyltransferase involved in cell wall biosynthesis